MKNSNFIHGALGGIWLVLSLVSVNHLFRVVDIPFLSATLLGLLGWLTVFATLIVLSYRFWRQALVVFGVFFVFGVWFGPFLEPPADPFEHLRRTNDYCEKRADELPQENMGFWHYSMSGIVLCGDLNKQKPETTLFKLDVLHGIYQGLLLTVLFVLGKSAGLPHRWAFLSCCIAFLFFGTNRFSYFSYYSFAPTFSSMLIYWLWIAVFFFRRNWMAIVSGVIVAILLVPILWVNHVQEVFLLGLVVSVWLFINGHEWIWRCCNTKTPIQVSGIGIKKMSLCGQLSSQGYWTTIFRFSYWACIIFVLCILPQWKFLQDALSTVFGGNYWVSNQHRIFYWNDWHLFGKIWGGRVNETFSWIGLLLLLLAVPFFCFGWIRKRNEKKVRVFLLAILPFIGYCIPLIHFVWVSTVRSDVYYRLGYSALFWLFFAYFLWGMEGRIILTARVIRRRWLHWKVK